MFAFDWRRKWLPTSEFLPGESHGQRSLAGYSPWGHRESDMTEQLTFLPLTPSDISEDMNTLQYICVCICNFMNILHLKMHFLEYLELYW